MLSNNVERLFVVNHLLNDSFLTWLMMNDNCARQSLVSGNSYDTLKSTMQNEHVSIRSLLQMIDEYQWTKQSSTLRELKEENRILQQQVSCYEKSWHTTMNLLQETFKIVLLIRDALNDYDVKVSITKKEWLTFWNIHTKLSERLNYALLKWI